MTLGAAEGSSSSSSHPQPSTTATSASTTGPENDEEAVQSEAEEGLSDGEWADLDAARVAMHAEADMDELHFRDALLGG
eukprot:1649540-Amphidinium_carterae.1